MLGIIIRERKTKAVILKYRVRAPLVTPSDTGNVISQDSSYSNGTAEFRHNPPTTTAIYRYSAKCHNVGLLSHNSL